MTTLRKADDKRSEPNERQCDGEYTKNEAGVVELPEHARENQTDNAGRGCTSDGFVADPEEPAIVPIGPLPQSREWFHGEHGQRPGPNKAYVPALRWNEPPGEKRNRRARPASAATATIIAEKSASPSSEAGA